MKGSPALHKGHGDWLPCICGAAQHPQPMGFPLLCKLGSPAPSLRCWAEALQGQGQLEVGRTLEDTRLQVRRPLPGVHPQPGSLGQGEAGGAGRPWGSLDGSRMAQTEVPGPDLQVHEHGVPEGMRQPGETWGGSWGQGSRELEGQGVVKEDAQPAQLLTPSGGH